MARHSQHVVPHEAGWAVRGIGSQCATSAHYPQSEAIVAGREIARNQRTELFILGRDGEFRERDSHSNDQFGPKA